ncbi:ResB protein required for cytochrome C biosynthesis, partial [bacterium]|nr:ResB protein required for cytochrome C biosynthesis [bacterium]
AIPLCPGGKLLGIVLFVNLVAAHLTKFKWTRAKIGIGLTHIGLLILLVGGGLTSLRSTESQMTIATGESVNYSESAQEVELAITRDLSPTQDRIVSIPQELLVTGGDIQHPALPFRIKIVAAYPNSRLEMNASVGSELPHATMGLGAAVTAFPMPTVVRDDYRNVVTAIVEIVAKDGSKGIWLLSNGLGSPQPVVVGDKSYAMIIRPVRYYLPFHLQLLKFTQEYYPDTTIPRRYASEVVIHDPAHKVDRNTTIYMNNPLRYQGRTFYQASFGQDGNSTVLQVVENPAWVFPYVSCAVISVGLMMQFMGSLGRFWKRRAR